MVTSKNTDKEQPRVINNMQSTQPKLICGGICNAKHSKLHAMCLNNPFCTSTSCICKEPRGSIPLVLTVFYENQSRTIKRKSTPATLNCNFCKVRLPSDNVCHEKQLNPLRQNYGSGQNNFACIWKQSIIQLASCVLGKIITQTLLLWPLPQTIGFFFLLWVWSHDMTLKYNFPLLTKRNELCPAPPPSIKKQHLPGLG